MRQFARHWKRHKPGQMNALEAKYAEHLELLKRDGKILWFRFEGIKLRLADKTFLTPDFFVVTDEGIFEAREVKGGFITDDAAVKLKVAAQMYPIRFLLIRRKAGQWESTEI